MSITSGIVLYAVLWFLILLMALPIGVKSQADTGRIEPGTPASAPDQPMVGRKMLWATALAAACWGVIVWLIEGGVVTHEDIRHFAPFD
jgi:predicted secreted protein